jgi:hypothetical protein
MPLIWQCIFLTFIPRDPTADKDDPTTTVSLYFATSMILVQIVGLTNSTMLVLFVAQAVEDKENRTKYLSLCHGLKPQYFWAGTFFANYSVVLVSNMITPIYIFMFQISGWSETADLTMLTLVCIVAPAAALFWGYAISGLFKKQTTVLKVIPPVNSFLTILPPIGVFLTLLPAVFAAVQDAIAHKGDPTYTEQSFYDKLFGSSWYGTFQIMHTVLALIIPMYIIPGTLMTLSFYGVVRLFLVTLIGIPMTLHDRSVLSFLDPLNPFMISVGFYCGLVQICYYSAIVWSMEYLDYNRKRLAQSMPRLASCLASIFCCFRACREIAPTDEERGRPRQSRA